jgi:hypothetical protein
MRNVLVTVTDFGRTNGVAQAARPSNMGFGRNSEAHQDARPLQVTVAVRYRILQFYASSSPGLTRA